MTLFPLMLMKALDAAVHGMCSLGALPLLCFKNSLASLSAVSFVSASLLSGTSSRSLLFDDFSPMQMLA